MFNQKLPAINNVVNFIICLKETVLLLKLS